MAIANAAPTTTPTGPTNTGLAACYFYTVNGGTSTVDGTAVVGFTVSVYGTSTITVDAGGQMVSLQETLNGGNDQTQPPCH